MEECLEVFLFLILRFLIAFSLISCSVFGSFSKKLYVISAMRLAASRSLASLLVLSTQESSHHRFAKVNGNQVAPVPPPRFFGLGLPPATSHSIPASSNMATVWSPRL